MSRSRLTHIVLSVVLLILSSCVLSNVKTIPVTFPSKAPSGLVTLFGTLYLPASSKASGAVVLVHGSGPNNRNESIQNYYFLNTDARPDWVVPHCGVTGLNFNTFFELAMDLASNSNLIVLTYDKRTCCKGHEKCSECTIDPITREYVSTCFYGCSPDNSPQQIDMNLLTLEDMALDAVNALNYLATRDDVDVTRLALLGHSEGVNVVIRSTNIFNSDPSNIQKKARVTNVFLMNGVVYDYGNLLVDQYNRITAKWQVMKKVCQDEDPTSPLIKNADQSIAITNATSIALAQFFPQFKAGLYPIEWAYNIGAYVSGRFLKSAFEFASVEFMRKNLITLQLDSNKPFVCSLNSQTDMNIQPPEYAQLIQVMKERDANRTMAQEINYLTHFDTPSDLSSQYIVPNVKSLIRFCLTKN